MTNRLHVVFHVMTSGHVIQTHTHTHTHTCVRAVSHYWSLGNVHRHTVVSPSTVPNDIIVHSTHSAPTHTHTEQLTRLAGCQLHWSLNPPHLTSVATLPCKTTKLTAMMLSTYQGQITPPPPSWTDFRNLFTE